MTRRRRRGETRSQRRPEDTPLPRGHPAPRRGGGRAPVGRRPPPAQHRPPPQGGSRERLAQSLPRRPETRPPTGGVSAIPSPPSRRLRPGTGPQEAPPTAAPPPLLTVWHSRVSGSAGSHSSLSLRSQCSSGGCSPPLSHTSMAAATNGAAPPANPPPPCLPLRTRGGRLTPRRPLPWAAEPPAGRSPPRYRAEAASPPPAGVCGHRAGRATPASCAPRPHRPAAAPRPRSRGRQSALPARLQLWNVGGDPPGASRCGGRSPCPAWPMERRGRRERRARQPTRQRQDYSRCSPPRPRGDGCVRAGGCGTGRGAERRLAARTAACAASRSGTSPAGSAVTVRDSPRAPAVPSPQRCRCGAPTV